MAAASIGQVYRARLHDGRDVAVKVQYPGVAQAVRADLQNLGLIMRVAKRIAPGMDVKAMTQEIRERLTDELDYEHEAQNHRAFARTWSGHPFIYVPPVVTRLCTEHVLVTEWVDGDRLRGGEASWSQQTRDRFGEIVFRFFFGSLYRTGHFSGRPAPGQLPADARRPRGVHRLRHDQAGGPRPHRGRGGGGPPRDGGRRRGPPRQLGAMGFFDADDEAVDPDAVLDHFRDVTRWYVDDGEVTIDRDGRRPGADRLRRPALPALGADEARDDAAAARCSPGAWRR